MRNHMESKQYYVQPKIASKIVELQTDHSLPVNIIVGETVNGMKVLSFCGVLPKTALMYGV